MMSVEERTKALLAVLKKLKCNKACDIYKVTAEHLKFAGDEVLSLLCTLVNRVLDDI